MELRSYKLERQTAVSILSKKKKQKTVSKTYCTPKKKNRFCQKLVMRKTFCFSLIFYFYPDAFQKYCGFKIFAFQKYQLNTVLYGNYYQQTPLKLTTYYFDYYDHLWRVYCM